MITRAEAEEIAAGWARRESERRGYACAPMLAEFDLGFVVWTKQPATVLPIPGDGARTVIDRETGVVSTYPGIPADVIAELYRSHRPGLAARRRTVDPEVELRREAHRRPSPTTAAHITVDGTLFRARGAKGDQEIRHHRLVAEYLRGRDPRAVVRGAERHAELIVLSDVLHEADPAITREAARSRLRTARFESFFVRETGDPRAGQPSRPCETCLVALVDFAVLPWPDLAYAQEWPARFSDRIAQPGRFPDAVAGQLADAGWTPMNRESAEVLADVAIDDVVKVPGLRHRHVPFPVVRDVLADFPLVHSGRRGPGARRAIRQFTIGPREAAHTADTLAELAAVVGAPLFPLGVEAGGDAVLAIDDRSRVFALDQGGEWFLGEGIDAVLTGLLTGDGPAERIRDDGTW